LQNNPVTLIGFQMILPRIWKDSFPDVSSSP
jgi:hypothetical protein